MRNFYTFKAFACPLHECQATFFRDYTSSPKEASALKVIPVLDILNGVAVHAIKGLRQEYKSLKSVICDSAEPLDVACAFRRLGFSEIYVADLDLITRRKQGNLHAIGRIANETELRLMVDAGVSSIANAKELFRTGASRVIIGTETLSGLSFVEEAVRFFGEEKIVVSVDMKNGRLLCGFDNEGRFEPIDLMNKLRETGLRQVILLDLVRVGSGEGVNKSFLREALNEFDFKVFVGGGVRNIDDLVELKNMGASGVLVASAIHSGAINVADLVAAGLEI